MAFVNKNAVNPQLPQTHHVIFTGLVVELFNFTSKFFFFAPVV